MYWVEDREVKFVTDGENKCIGKDVDGKIKSLDEDEVKRIKQMKMKYHPN